MLRVHSRNFHYTLAYRLYAQYRLGRRIKNVTFCDLYLAVSCSNDHYIQAIDCRYSNRCFCSFLRKYRGMSFYCRFLDRDYVSMQMIQLAVFCLTPFVIIGVNFTLPIVLVRALNMYASKEYHKRNMVIGVLAGIALSINMIGYMIAVIQGYA